MFVGKILTKKGCPPASCATPKSGLNPYKKSVSVGDLRRLLLRLCLPSAIPIAFFFSRQNLATPEEMKVGAYAYRWFYKKVLRVYDGVWNMQYITFIFRYTFTGAALDCNRDAIGPVTRGVRILRTGVAILDARLRL